MKLYFLLTLFTFLPWLALAQPTNQIVIGRVDSLQSKILHEKRKIWVHLPKSYKADGAGNQRYPVVYLLDGDGHFSSVVGMIDYLSPVSGNMICPEMIVVGIPNTNRMRDLTPSPGGGASPADSMWLKTTGGGEAFTSFIELELYKKAESLFSLNVTRYPQSPNAHDAYGDYFAARNDTTNAIAQFRKALALKETPETRKKLTDLQAKTASSGADKPQK